MIALFKKVSAALSRVVVILLVTPPLYSQSTQAVQGRPITLQEAFHFTKQNSETIAASQAGIEEAKHRVKELWGTALPQINLQATEFIQDSATAGGGVQSTFNRRERPEAKITFNQQIFSGFREFLGIKALRFRKEGLELDLARATSLLYMDVARAYLDLLGAQRELATRQTTVELTKERVKDLESRAKLGRSRNSEVLAAKVQLSRLEAQLPEVAGREAASQAVLGYMTGIEQRLAPQEPKPPTQTDLTHSLNLARIRSDVESLRRQFYAAEFIEKAQRRERWPTLSVGGAWYLKRVGFQEDINWDMTFAANLPLFTGNQITSRISQAELRRKAAEFNLRGTERLAQSEVKAAWTQLASSIERIGSLMAAVDLAERNARAQSEDYRLGVVTNLDVLAALTQLQDARLDLENAKLSAALWAVQLETAAGGPK
ncbi:MAG: TolC family protein [Elusimicrobia bacterium]|nr:TolC family protein [Elusimicrobiota bacterium]